MKTKILLFILLFTQIANSQEKKMRSIEDFANPALQTASTHLRSSTDNDEFSQKALHPESEPLTFVQSPNYPWVVGEEYVKSSNAGLDGTSSWFSATVENEYEISISFEWYSASEGNYDFFNFWVGEALALHHSGEETEFKTTTVILPAGSHTITWEYTKDVIISAGIDEAQVRNIKVHYYEESNPNLAFNIVDGVLTGYLGIGGNVVIPEEVTAIGNGVFRNNTTITSVTIPSTVTSIEDSTFYNCRNLASITIPNTVTSIGDYAFAYCNYLQSITVSWTTPLAISSSVFYKVDKHRCTLNVPAELLAAYQAASVWKAFFDESDFEIDDNGVLVAYYGSGGEVVIPDGVTAIGNEVFYNNLTITSVVIPDGVTSIGNYAFTYCFNLASVVFPNTVTSIGSSAFYNCPGLTSITLPESLTTIGNSAFYYCTNLTSVTFPESLTSIGNYAFGDCSKLTSITLPESLISIGDYAFYYCQSFTSITIPNSVTSIGNSAFANCNSLQSITVSWATPLSISATVFNGVNKRTCTLIVPEGSLAAYQVAPVWKAFFDESDFEIDDNGVLVAYYGDGGEVVIPDGVTAIGNGVFQSNATITSVTIPEGVTSIGNYVFYYCQNLASITIPNSVTSIGNYAFANCNSLQSITVSWATPLEISATVFNGVNKRNCTLNVPEGSLAAYQAAPVWKAFFDESDFEIDDNGVLVAYYGSGGEVVIPDGVTAIGERVFYNNTTITSVTIPEGVASIGSSAFDYCSNLTSVTFPESLTSIGNYAFGDCSKLTSITLPENLASIGNYAFGWCQSLTSVVIPDGVINIGNGAFYYCQSLTSITIPNTVTSIGNSAFAYCNSLQSITVQWATPLEISATVFEGVNKRNCTLIVPEGSLAAYQVAPVWKAFLDDSDFEIDENGVLTAYYGAGGAVVIPDGVTAIGNRVFQNNTTITSVTIPEGVTSIGNYVFYYCTNLTSITLPESLTSIGNYAFGGCSKLTSITLPESLTSIGNYAFYYCQSLTSITIPNTVTSIGNYAFAYCTRLQSITVLWATPLVISGNVFNKVNKHTCTLNVPEGSLAAYQAAQGWKAFFDNSDFEIDENGVLVAYYGSGGDIIIPDGVTAIGEEVFNGNTTITSVVIPEGVTRIEYYAFGYCSNLASPINIPASVNYIGDYAFTSCIAVSAFHVDENSLYYSSVEGVLFDKAQKRLIQYPAAGSTIYTTPLSVTDINPGAFAGSNVTEVVIASPISNLRGWTFSSCSNLVSVTLPESLTFIDVLAFQSCSSLANVTCLSLVPPGVYVDGWNDAFERVNINSCTLLVPLGTKELYEIADVWKDFGTIVEVEVNSIDNSLAPHNNTVSLNIKDGILQIDSSVSEQITIYSINGIRLFRNEKPQSKVVFHIGRLQDKILIIKGSSGWVRKILN